MSSFSIQEFKPTILFLARFLVFYLVGNLLYGLFVTSYVPEADPVTRSVTKQTSAIITALGWSTTVREHASKPTTLLLYEGNVSLAVYEGCNGINTMVIFAAFIFGFGPWNKKMLWFVPAGLLIIHVANLMRVGLLFFVAEYQPDFMYFVHKYLFTGFLYLIIFCLWIWWIKLISKRARRA
jgi:exosortase family protein XrtF